MIRDEKAKKDLIEYINDYPEQRLWQAIRNWCGYGFVFIGNKLDKSDAIDTFHLESKIQENK